MDKLKKLIEELKALDAKLDRASADDATAEERAAFEQLQAERSKVAETLQRERDKIKRAQETAELEGKVEKTEKKQAELDAQAARKAEQATRNQLILAGQGRLSAADLPPGGNYHIGGSPKGGRGDWLRGARLHTPRNFRGDANGYSAQERAYRFGAWCLAQMCRSIPGQFHGLRAVENWVERYAVGETDSSGYSNLVPEQFSADLVQLKEARGVVRQVFKRQPMDSDTWVTARRTGGLTAFAVVENAAGTESNKTWDQIRLTAKQIMVLTRYSNQVNADSMISIGDDLAGEIAYALADYEDKAGINGDGSFTYAGIFGLRFKIANFDLAGTASSGLVQGSGAAWSNLTLADFNSVVGKLPAYADNESTAWLCHRTFWASVMAKLEAAGGGNALRDISEGDRRSRPLFLGYPVIFSQVMPSASAGATTFALLGDYQQAAFFGDRQGDEISFSESASIGGQSVFERNQVAVRGVERMDINVHDAGDATNPGPFVGLKTA